MKKHFFKLSLACLLFVAGTVEAKIELPKIFTDNMVLQQKSSAPIWGKATADKNVIVKTSWDGRTYTVKADATGKWKTNIETPTAGGPYTISISDGKELKLKNVLIGEVWVCSGQSNMEMPLAGWGKINNYEQEIAQANYPQIRLFHVEHRTSTSPLDEFEATRGDWKECSPATVAEFSSVAYFFGRNLNQNLNIPIGLISTSWGGTIAEAWTSGESLEQMPYFAEAVENMRKFSEEEAQTIYEQKYKEWNAQILKADGGYQNSKVVYGEQSFDDLSWKIVTAPALWNDGELGDFDGIAWLRKTVEIPANWQGKELVLNLAFIDDNDITYFNGVEVGQTEGYNQRRTYTIPAKLVKQGKAVISVRVTDTGGGGGIYGDNEVLSIGLKTKRMEDFISLNGDWKYKISVDLKQYARAPQSQMGNPNRPTVLFNAMIHPMLPFKVKGAIWYQGESNADRAYQYRDLFPLMIRDWRKQWNDNLDFYFVQLASYQKRNAEPAEADWAELREAQSQTLSLENTGMAVTIDIGDAEDIHPKNKQDVGLRLALAARANTYGEKIAYSGPIYSGYTIEQNKIRISFKNTDKGLKAEGGKVVGFAIAGQDHKFYWADAVIEGNEVVVSAPSVEFPVAVRYGWSINPEVNLYNGAGLPASPFRTDDWRR